jgi:hypothetical protein
MKNDPIDLSSESPTTFEPPKYNSLEHRDNVRKMVSAWLLIILTGCAGLVAYVLVFRPPSVSCEGAKDIALLLFTPVLTAVSSMLGFYFAEKSN